MFINVRQVNNVPVRKKQSRERIALPQDKCPTDAPDFTRKVLGRIASRPDFGRRIVGQAQLGAGRK
jgi:hypothetical protein